MAIYIIRFLSIFFGLGTILVTARLGLILLGPTVALLASAPTAFNLMFIFVNTSVNNNSLAISLGLLALICSSAYSVTNQFLGRAGGDIFPWD